MALLILISGVPVSVTTAEMSDDLMTRGDVIMIDSGAKQVIGLEMSILLETGDVGEAIRSRFSIIDESHKLIDKTPVAITHDNSNLYIGYKDGTVSEYTARETDGYTTHWELGRGTTLSPAPSSLDLYGGGYVGWANNIDSKIRFLQRSSMVQEAGMKVDLSDGQNNGGSPAFAFAENPSTCSSLNTTQSCLVAVEQSGNVVNGLNSVQDNMQNLIPGDLVDNRMNFDNEGGNENDRISAIDSFQSISDNETLDHWISIVGGELRVFNEKNAGYNQIIDSKENANRTRTIKESYATTLVSDDVVEIKSIINLGKVATSSGKFPLIIDFPVLPKFTYEDATGSTVEGGQITLSIGGVEKNVTWEDISGNSVAWAPNPTHEMMPVLYDSLPNTIDFEIVDWSPKKSFDATVYIVNPSRVLVDGDGNSTTTDDLKWSRNGLSWQKDPTHKSSVTTVRQNSQIFGNRLLDSVVWTNDRVSNGLLSGITGLSVYQSSMFDAPTIQLGISKDFSIDNVRVVQSVFDYDHLVINKKTYFEISYSLTAGFLALNLPSKVDGELLLRGWDCRIVDSAHKDGDDANYISGSHKCAKENRPIPSQLSDLRSIGLSELIESTGYWNTVAQCMLLACENFYVVPFTLAIDPDALSQSYEVIVPWGDTLVEGGQVHIRPAASSSNNFIATPTPGWAGSISFSGIVEWCAKLLVQDSVNSNNIDCGREVGTKEFSSMDVAWVRIAPMTENDCTDWDWYLDLGWEWDWWSSHPTVDGGVECDARNLWSHSVSESQSRAVAQMSEAKLQDMYPTSEYDVDFDRYSDSFTKGDKWYIPDWVESAIFYLAIFGSGLYGYEDYDRVFYLLPDGTFSNVYGDSGGGVCPCMRLAQGEYNSNESASADTAIHELGHSYMLPHDNSKETFASELIRLIRDCGPSDTYEPGVNGDGFWDDVGYMDGESFMRYKSDRNNAPTAPASDFGYESEWISDTDYEWILDHDDYSGGPMSAMWHWGAAQIDAITDELFDAFYDLMPEWVGDLIYYLFGWIIEFVVDLILITIAGALLGTIAITDALVDILSGRSIGDNDIQELYSTSMIVEPDNGQESHMIPFLSKVMAGGKNSSIDNEGSIVQYLDSDGAILGEGEFTHFAVDPDAFSTFSRSNERPVNNSTYLYANVDTTMITSSARILGSDLPLIESVRYMIITENGTDILFEGPINSTSWKVNTNTSNVDVQRGSEYNLTWEYDGGTPTESPTNRVEMSYDGGNSWNSIANGITNKYYVVPQDGWEIGDKYVFKVSSSDGVVSSNSTSGVLTVTGIDAEIVAQSSDFGQSGDVIYTVVETYNAGSTPCSITMDSFHPFSAVDIYQSGNNFLINITLADELPYRGMVAVTCGNSHDMVELSFNLPTGVAITNTFITDDSDDVSSDDAVEDSEDGDGNALSGFVKVLQMAENSEADNEAARANDANPTDGGTGTDDDNKPITQNANTSGAGFEINNLMYAAVGLIGGLVIGVALRSKPEDE